MGQSNQKGFTRGSQKEEGCQKKSGNGREGQMEGQTQKEYTSQDCYKKADLWERREANQMRNVEEEKTNILNIFRNTSLLNDDPIWIILEFAGICGSGRYSIFFWVYS